MLIMMQLSLQRPDVICRQRTKSNGCAVFFRSDSGTTRGKMVEDVFQADSSIQTTLEAF